MGTQPDTLGIYHHGQRNADHLKQLPHTRLTMQATTNNTASHSIP